MFDAARQLPSDTRGAGRSQHLHLSTRQPMPDRGDWHRRRFDLKTTAELFDHFYRSNTSRTANRVGNAIALTIAKAIIHAHGDNCWAIATATTRRGSVTSRGQASGHVDDRAQRSQRGGGHMGSTKRGVSLNELPGGHSPFLLRPAELGVALSPDLWLRRSGASLP
jgi:hypothetical protein